MEEGECSQEFAKVKQEMEQADLCKKRLMEEEEDDMEGQQEAGQFLCPRP
jgi:hypothetical protein